MAAIATVPKRVLLRTTDLPSKANLYGFVHDTAGDPVPAVGASLDGRTTTGSLQGVFGFLDLEPGEYTIRCVKEGYQTYSKRLTLQEGEEVIDILMLAEGEKPAGKFPWLWVGLGALGATSLGLIIAGSEKKATGT